MVNEEWPVRRRVSVIREMPVASASCFTDTPRVAISSRILPATRWSEGVVMWEAYMPKWACQAPSAKFLVKQWDDQTMYLTRPFGYLGVMGNRPFDPAVGLNAAVAAVLEGERAAARMTLQELADASGVSYRTLQRYAARERNIDVAALDGLARAFRTTPEQILAAAHERMRRGMPDADDDAETARAVAQKVAKAQKKPPSAPPTRRKTS